MFKSHTIRVLDHEPHILVKRNLGNHLTLSPCVHVCIPIIGPYKNQHLTLLDTIFKKLMPENEQGVARDGLFETTSVFTALMSSHNGLAANQGYWPPCSILINLYTSDAYFCWILYIYFKIQCCAIFSSAFSMCYNITGKIKLQPHITLNSSLSYWQNSYRVLRLHFDMVDSETRAKGFGWDMSFNLCTIRLCCI